MAKVGPHLEERRLVSLCFCWRVCGEMEAEAASWMALVAGGSERMGMAVWLGELALRCGFGIELERDLQWFGWRRSWGCGG